MSRKTPKAHHIIGDIHYEHNGPSWLVCDEDGARLDAPTPTALAELWVAHGGTADRTDAERVQSKAVQSKTGPKPQQRQCQYDGCTKLTPSLRHRSCIDHRGKRGNPKNGRCTFPGCTWTAQHVGYRCRLHCDRTKCRQSHPVSAMTVALFERMGWPLDELHDAGAA